MRSRPIVGRNKSLSLTQKAVNCVFLAHVAATLFMTGVIWFVQVVHYPLYAHVGNDSFPDYESNHTHRTTWVVAPAMFVEALTAILLCLARPNGIDAWQTSLGIALVVVIWLSTAFLQVPRHKELSRSFEAISHHALVATNWLRTMAWSLRSILVLLMARQLMTAPELGG